MQLRRSTLDDGNLTVRMNVDGGGGGERLMDGKVLL